jgi:hypothetical protein
VVTAQGLDYLNSVSLLRYNQRRASYHYWTKGEDIPPAPQVSATGLDGEIIISWDDAAVEFQQGENAFEGFNVFQSESEQGPWTRLATYDKINHIKYIRGMNYNPAVGEVINSVMQKGSDSGLQFYFHPERDTINGGPFINGQTYYFAVSSYT